MSSTAETPTWRGCLTSRESARSLDLRQIVAVDAERFLAMVEIRAERNGAALHNFAAFLGRVVEEHVHELWMVDAQPRFSDQFWAT